ncbi:hypothetical protein GN156_32510, partial [bacterium LRH843]|nr:hypothetical protein [bacterium LRH843]
PNDSNLDYSYQSSYDEASQSFASEIYAIQNQSGVGSAIDAIANIPVPTLKPENINYTDAEGNTETFQGHTGDINDLLGDALTLNDP